MKILKRIKWKIKLNKIKIEEEIADISTSIITENKVIKTARIF